MLRFFKGQLGSSAQLAAQIKRVVIAGDSMIQPDKIDEVLRGSYRTNKIN